jgi:hypothetical protein
VAAIIKLRQELAADLAMESLMVMAGQQELHFPIYKMVIPLVLTG